MCMQNGKNHEFCICGILIDTFQLELWPLKVRKRPLTSCGGRGSWRGNPPDLRQKAADCLTKKSQGTTVPY